MPTYSKYSGMGGSGGIQSINSSTIPAQSIVGSGDVTVSTVTGTGVTTVSLGTPLSTFANTSLSNLANPTALNRVLRGQDGTAAAPAYSFTSSTGTGIYLPANNFLGLATAGVERMRIRGDGYVTIGDTGAAAKFNVYGATGVLGNGINLWETSTGTNKRLYIYQDTDRVVYDATFGSGGNAHAFNTGGTEKMQITSAGQVLVGTNAARTAFLGGAFTPRLQLEGPDNSTSSFSLVNNFNGLAQSSGIIFGRARSGTNGGFGLVADDDTIGNLHFAGSTSTALRSCAQIRASIDGTPSDTAMPGKLQFYTVPANSLSVQERMRITSAGNVGINNPAPSRQLTIQNVTASQPATFAFLNTTNLAAGGGTYEAGSIEFLTNDVASGLTAPVALSKISSIADNSASTVPGGILAFFSNQEGVNQTQLPIERMRITPTGNVGIGTTNPVSSLAVQRENASTEITNTVYGVSATNLSNLICRSAGGTVASPTAILSGDRILSLLGAGYDGTAFRNQVAVIGESSENWSGTNRGSYLRFETTANASSTRTERMRIDGAGNVGIGTNSPVSSLTIPTSTSTTLTASGTGMVSDSLGYTAVQFYEGGSTGGLRLISRHPSSANFSWIGFATGTGASATERMRIDNAGNVGIGTASPSARLHVQSDFGGVNDAVIINNGTTSATAGRGSRIAFTGTGNTTIASIESQTSTTSNTEGSLFLRAIGSSGIQSFTTNGSERMRIDNAGNVGVKATSFGTSAAAALGIANGTEPSSSVADQIVIGSVDLTAGNTIPYFRSEGTGMTGAGITNTTVTHKIAIKVNGTVYYLLATTNGT